MKDIIHLVNVSPKPLFKASAKLMTELFTISRLKYKPDLLPLLSVCPMPQIPRDFNLSFEEVAIKRATFLWKTSPQNEVSNLLWSGGIDSTVALSALIMTRPPAGRINIYCNLHSILENNALYKKLLSFNFIHFKNSSFISNNLEIEMITGDLGDQIFGSDHIFSVGNLFGFDKNFESYQDVLPNFFSAKAGLEFGEKLYEKYLPIVDEAPFKISSAYDFFWWWNLTQKWQSSKFHLQSLLDPVVSPVHFFEDQDFQLWSLFNHHLKINKTIESYKMPAKEFIFKLDKNTEYLQFKKKYPSPLGNKRYHYALNAHGHKLTTHAEAVELINQLSPEIHF